MKKIYTSPLCSCIICKQIKSAKGIHSHYITAHTSDGNSRVRSTLEQHAYTRITNIKHKVSMQHQLYLHTPNYCKNCNTTLRYKDRKNKFCSKSCAASFSNKTRVLNGYQITDEHKIKTSNTLKSKRSTLTSYTCKVCKSIHYTKERKQQCCYNKKTIHQVRKITAYETKTTPYAYSTIKYCTCKICKCNFTSITQLQYCSVCTTTKVLQRSRYRFKFNIFNYPDLFDIPKLIEVGFYSAGGKSGAWNINGLSRDHRVSITDAITNGYDPYYISHPCNCELMVHSQNTRKHTKSSLSYSDLVYQVDQYDLVKDVRFELTSVPM
jgi:hypothetical protein